MIICITGGDGVGKSTLAKSVKDQLHRKNKSCEIANIWDSMQIMSKTLGVDFSSKDKIQKYLGTIDQASRLYFLFHAMQLSTHMAMSKKADFTLLDSYWFKYAVHESQDLSRLELLKSTAALFLKPDITFWLKLDLTSQVQRKKQVGFSDYEVLGLKGAEAENKFIEITEKGEALFENLRDSSWNILDATHSTQNLALKILEQII